MLPVLLACSVGLAIQDPPPPAATGGEPRVARVGSAELRPVIDGSLQDACWAGATPIGALVEVEPRLGAVPEQRTVVRIMHDAKTLYMAIECFDDDPSEIRATQRSRDADLEPDDRVEWFFDPFENRRDGIWFQIGAAGSRGDALIGPTFEKSWDTIWKGRSRVTARGWQAEVAIPFQSLSFRDGARSWGFNLRRVRRKTNTESRWANPRQAISFFRVAEAGTLTGFGPLDQGIGLDVVPFTVVRGSRQRLSGDGDWRDDVDAGGDVFYRLTPSLTVATTFFTDFAETENDSRQINLTRFPLFFPEKRDFFLKDSSRFTFGPSGGRSFVPFFSRRIGLDGDGNEVSLLAGAKVTGRQGPWEIGFLDVWTDTSEAVSSRRNLGVLRLKRDLAEQTSVGFLGTLGRPSEPGRNSTYGFDFYHREEEFIGGGDLRLWAYAMGSQTSGGGGDGNIFGVQAQGDAREWRWNATTRWTTDDFNPELGFVRRRGVKEFDARVRWLPRPGGRPVRNWEFGVQTQAVLNESNVVTDAQLRLTPLGVRIQNGDELSLNLERTFERISEDFTIFDDTATIRAGDYWVNRVVVQAESSEGRAFSSDLRLSTGGFYDGESHDASIDATWRIGALVALGTEYEWRRVRLPGNRFETQVVEARVDLDFTPDLTLRNLVQFDNESDLLGVQSRLRWIFEPGSDLFVVVGNTWAKGDGSFRPDEQAGTVKVVHTFRF